MASSLCRYIYSLYVVSRSYVRVLSLALPYCSGFGSSGLCFLSTVGAHLFCLARPTQLFLIFLIQFDFGRLDSIRLDSTRPRVTTVQPQLYLLAHACTHAATASSSVHYDTPPRRAALRHATLSPSRLRSSKADVELVLRPFSFDHVLLFSGIRARYFLKPIFFFLCN